MNKKYFIFFGIIIIILTFALVYFLYESKNDKNKTSWIENIPLRYVLITKCDYKGEVVYYLNSPGGDIPERVYNESGGIICVGVGFTGKGGECHNSFDFGDFFAEAENCELFLENPNISVQEKLSYINFNKEVFKKGYTIK